MERLGDIEKGTVDKSQLIEYDTFYKEQYYKNEVFNYNVSDIKDKEMEKINHEMNKLEAHRKLLPKRKEKDAVEKKGLDTTIPFFFYIQNLAPNRLIFLFLLNHLFSFFYL